jgi:hypothetical protein
VAADVNVERISAVGTDLLPERVFEGDPADRDREQNPANLSQNAQPKFQLEQKFNVHCVGVDSEGFSTCPSGKT